MSRERVRAPHLLFHDARPARHLAKQIIHCFLYSVLPYLQTHIPLVTSSSTLSHSEPLQPATKLPRQTPKQPHHPKNPPNITTPSSMSHHHDHSHGHAHDDEHADAHDHDHDHSDDITPALQNLLYEQIDFSKLHKLNEEASNSGRAICQKTWAQRMEVEPELRSSADEQVIVVVPYAISLFFPHSSSQLQPWNLGESG